MQQSNEISIHKDYKYIIQSTVYESAENKTAFYKACEVGTGRVVGIKVIDAANQTALRAYMNEVNVLAKLESHDANIPVIYYSYYRGTRLYIVMQYIEGDTLAKKIDADSQYVLERETTFKNLKRLTSIAGVLRSIHRKIAGMGDYTQHKDLKPQNIIIKGTYPREKIYLVDFGISASRTMRGTGTLGYQSPEQSALFSGSADSSRVDVFSFGLIMYELLCGKRLVLGEDLVLDKQTGEWKNIPLITKVNANVPRQIDDILRQCLAYNPKKRLRDGGAIECLLKKTIR